MVQLQTFRDLLIHAASHFGEQPFLIDDPLLGSVTYADVLKFSTGFEAHLDALGIPPGATVATLFHNSGIAAVLFLATIASRRVLVPLNPLSTTYELDFVLDRAKCLAVIADPTHAKSSQYGDLRTITFSDHSKYFAERCAAGGASRFEAKLPTRDVFVGEIVFTSGSTGRPKGVVLSERSLLANANSLVIAYDLKASDRFLTVCPLFHNSGQLLTTLACALVGGSTAPVKSDVGMLHFWFYFDKYRAQWTLGMNSFLALLLSSPEMPKHPESIRGILTGGSAIDGALVDRFEKRFNVPVRTVYGLTETSSISTCEHLDPSPRSLGSSGRPLTTCRVRIGPTPVDSMDSQSGQSGEIWISGPHVFDGYVADPELTLSRKHGEWLQTGDIGYFDDNGNLFVVDRADSMLIVGGENVYPAEIEKLVALLPNAAQIVLVGLDHPIWGKELVLVYRTLDAGLAPIAAWHRIFAEHLSAAKIPQRYVSVRELALEDFPRKSNGKLDKPALTAMLKSGNRASTAPA